MKSATETDNALTKKHADTDYSVISVLLCCFLFGGNYPHFGRITPRTLTLLICIISQHSDPCGVIFVLDVAALSLFAGVAAVFVAYRVAVKEGRRYVDEITAVFVAPIQRNCVEARQQIIVQRAGFAV